MSKKPIIVILAVGLILGIIGGMFYFLSGRLKGSSSEKNPISEGLFKNVVKDKVAGDLLYEDTAGFSFRYPKGLKVEDITPDDGVYYSKVTLSKGDRMVTVSIFDTKETVVDNFVKKDPNLKGSTLYGAVNLGNLSAKQYSTEKSLYTLALDQGILYMIDGPKDGDFWEKAQGVVVDTFTLSSQKSGGSAGGSDNTIYEEEEVVE